MAYPQDPSEIGADLQAFKVALRGAGVPRALIASIETRALRSGRRQTGLFRSNRDPRWKLQPDDPQFGTESDCKIIAIRLLGMLLEFEGGPAIDAAARALIEQKYFGGKALAADTYRDALLLEKMRYHEFVDEFANPVHGHSRFHIGHEDPALVPKHIPDNVRWRTHRSNLIQGDMTLREARVYILRLLARYLELGEIEIQ